MPFLKNENSNLSTSVSIGHGVILKKTENKNYNDKALKP
jgi:hypothetical protein